jgi:hypothetical protein
MDEIEEAPRPGESDFRPGFPSTWRRAARLIDRFGADEALALLDQRAERCIERADLPSAIRWRNVMAAIHAIILDDWPKSRLN